MSTRVAVLVHVSRRIRRVRMYDFAIPGRITVSIDEHIEIAERVAEGRLETARRLPHEHIGALPGDRRRARDPGLGGDERPPAGRTGPPWIP